MKLIAHRGNWKGPNPERENSPEYIIEALGQGFYVEIDVRFIRGEFYLGHDEPQYKVSKNFLMNPRFYIHCKNIGALREILEMRQVCFFHDQDDATLTSNGEIWTFPGRRLTSKSICVMPEWNIKTDKDWTRFVENVGVCSDYLEETREKLILNVVK